MDPLGQLLSLLSPEKKQWLQSQTAEKQQSLAERFVQAGRNSENADAKPTTPVTNKALDPNAAQDKANTLIEEAQSEER
jgi:hypothetical protein